jgi:hypothetical protein
MGDLTYALAGRVPDPFPFGELKVIDLDTGQEVLDVLEVNTTEGWLVSYKRDGRGFVYADPDCRDQVARQRIEGRFKIVRKS